MPANAPKKMPKYGFPNIKTDPNAATAPVSIIPSTPKFKTPLLSVINSPVPANRIGIEVNKIVINSCSIT